MLLIFAQYTLDMSSVRVLTLRILSFTLLGGFFDSVVSDYLWARSVILTSPTIATLGLTITIPLGLGSDYLLFRKVPTLLSLAGAFLVGIGFIVVNLFSSH